MKKLALATALAASLFANETPFSVHLNDPEYSGGVIRTKEGGVVKGGGVRIQAQNIDYRKKMEEGKLVRTVVARGDIVLDYHGRIFVGKKLEYDFVTGTGTLEDAVASVGAWYVGGEKIQLNADGSVQVSNAYVTASTCKDREWDIYSSMMKINKESEVASRGVQVRVARAPIFWIPAFRANLKTISDHPVRYALTWDRGQGPQLSMRYRLYSWENFNLYGRADYRWKRGPGGAIEADYTSPDGRTKLKAKNFYAYDTFWNDNDPNKREKRYRLQGMYHTETASKKTTFDLAYDKISDRNMPGDFRSEEFELNAAKRTQVVLSHNTDHYISGVNVRPRINYFQGFKQELPSIHMATKPFVFPKTGAILDNRFRLSYLDYTYSSEVQGMIPDFASMRGAIHEKLYRPFNLGGFIFTPHAGFDGIVYSNSPRDESITQAIFSYGARGYTTFEKTYAGGSHTLTPYAEYQGLSRPVHNENDYYIFGIGDGFHRLNLFRIGVKNDYALKTAAAGKPTLTTDLYALGFFGDTTFAKTFPKVHLDIAIHFPKVNFSSRFGWNTEENVLNYANFALDWTINSDYALSLEWLHRSKFHWRKDDHSNYILDVTRTAEQLLDSPLSDGRNTLLAKAQLRLAPNWFCRLQTHTGWGRGAREKGYTEGKIDFFTLIATNWQLRLSYMHTVRDDQFRLGLFLVNK